MFGIHVDVAFKTFAAIAQINSHFVYE